jgi:TPR repeat protein
MAVIMVVAAALVVWRFRPDAPGRGVARDDARSADRLRRAAERGHIPAQYELGLRYAEGRGVPKDEERAVEWFAKAAARGHPAAKSELARRGRS